MPAPVRTNYIRHLHAFYGMVRKNDRLRANHISLYLALFQTWNYHRFQNPFPVIRAEVLRLCRIGSHNTYTRCLKDLEAFGFISYHRDACKGQPSLISIALLVPDRPAGAGGSQLSLFEEPGSPCIDSETGDGQEAPGTDPKIDTATGRNFETRPVAILRPLYKQVNIDKTEGAKTPTPIKKSKAKIREAGMDGPARTGAPGAPGLESVIQFFRDAGYPDAEGRKFFHHYQANGWRQAGKTPLRDWHAAGHKWMLNIHPKTPENNGKPKPGQGGPGRLQADTDKSYTDPL